MLTSLFSRPISELDVATAGDANATKFFSLASESLFTLFTEILLLATRSENLGPSQS